MINIFEEHHQVSREVLTVLMVYDKVLNSESFMYTLPLYQDVPVN